jgi:hypothetical protein
MYDTDEEIDQIAEKIALVYIQKISWQGNAVDLAEEFHKALIGIGDYFRDKR